MSIYSDLVEPIAGLFVDISRLWERPFDKLRASGGYRAGDTSLD
jgi:hypothetical protein